MEVLDDFYTANEAREKLGGVAAEELKRYVEAGKVEKFIPPQNKRKGFYRKSDIDRLAREARISAKSKDENSQLTMGNTDWAASSDLPYMLAYDYENYGPANTVDISITRTWWEKNPYMARILFNANDRRDVWGRITIMPMNEETIIRLLRDEITEHQITANDILAYEKGNTYHCYVASATVKEKHASHFRELLNSVFNFWCDNYPEIQIEKLYAYAGSEKGWDLIKRLFFAPRYDIGQNAFELCPLLRNPSKLLKPFQECLVLKGAKIEAPI